MKNLDSVASAEVMGADLAEAEVGMMEKTKDLAGDERDKVTPNGEINGEDDKDSSNQQNNEIEVAEKNSEEGEEKDVNDEEDKVSLVSLSQSTDFEVSPSSEVLAAKEAEETKEISKHSDITTEDFDDKSEGTEEIPTSQGEDMEDGHGLPREEGAATDDDEEKEESKVEKKEDVKAVEGEEPDQECISEAPEEGNKEQEDEEKSTEDNSSQKAEEKENSINLPSKIDEVTEDKIESEGKTAPTPTEDDGMNLVLTSDGEEASEEKKVEELKKVEEPATGAESQEEHDDAYGSDDESMDGLDINKGLQECFKNLEEKIAKEAEEEESGIKDEETEACLDKEVEKEKEKSAAEVSEETEPRQKTAEEKMEEEM